MVRIEYTSKIYLMVCTHMYECRCTYYVLVFGRDVLGLQISIGLGILLNQLLNWTLKHIIKEPRPTQSKIAPLIHHRTRLSVFGLYSVL